MEELIKITERDGKRAVSARELHMFLESKQQFADWIKNRIEQYGFIENEDFVTIHKLMNRKEGVRGASKLIEYALTLDCAKELAMVEGNDKGRQARRYFIERDKELRNIEQGELGSGRYDASRNILPGFHLPKTMMIGGSAVWTILLDGILYYRLKDILIAADMYKYERSVRYTNHAAFKPYVYWFNDKIGNKPKRYLTKDGALLVFSNTRMTGNPKLPLFLDSFKSGIENAGKITESKDIKTGNIDLKKFLDVIINTKDDDNRSFLYDIYEKLK